MPGCHIFEDPIEGDELKFSQDGTALIEWAKRCGAFVEMHQAHELKRQGDKPNLRPVMHLLVELVLDISKQPEGSRELDDFTRHFLTLTETRHPLLSFKNASPLSKFTVVFILVRY